MLCLSCPTQATRQQRKHKDAQPGASVAQQAKEWRQRALLKGAGGQQKQQQHQKKQKPQGASDAGGSGGHGDKKRCVQSCIVCGASCSSASFTPHHTRTPARTCRKLEADAPLQPSNAKQQQQQQQKPAAGGKHSAAQQTTVKGTDPSSAATDESGLQFARVEFGQDRCGCIQTCVIISLSD